MTALRRGDLMYYIRDDTAPVKLLSEPYEWGGQMVVTAKKMAKKKCEQKIGMYAVSALRRSGDVNDHA